MIATKEKKIKVKLNLHPGQERVMDSEKRFVAALAGTQGGKTVLVPPWLHKEIGARGRGDYLAATANYDLFKIKLLPELLEYFVTDLGIGKYWAGDRIIEIAKDLYPGRFMAKTKDSPMWARIILRSAQAEAGLESGTILAAALDEADHPDFSRGAWEGVQRRLSIAQGRCLFTTSLYHWGWLKNDIYDKWKQGDPNIDVIQFDSIENPSFPMVEYRRMEQIMPRWKFNLLYRGIYEKPAGLIYDSFDDVVCKIKRFPLNKDWPRFVGHDFGGANPAAMFYAQDPGTGLFYAYHEYLPGQGKSTYEHVEEFKKITAGTNVIKRAGGSHQEEEIRQGYAAHGWPIQEPKWGKVDTQIDKVYALHKLNKIMVFDDLGDYLGEKLSYSRKLDNDYEPTEEIDNKASFHLMDAERYILSDFTPETVDSGDGEVTFY